jgi:hypothetical protein
MIPTMQTADIVPLRPSIEQRPPAGPTDSDRTRVLELDDATELAASVPAGLALTAATNSLRITYQRRFDTTAANANGNALIVARLLIERLLDGPQEVSFEAMAEAEALCREVEL